MMAPHGYEAYFIFSPGEDMDRNLTSLFVMKLIVDRAATLYMARANCPVTSAQGRVIMYLEKQAPRCVPQHELEAFMGVSHATVKGLVTRLEERGYVRTAFDGEDGRVKNVYLTEAVQRDKEKVRSLLQKIERQVMKGFSAQDKKNMRRMLEKMYENIS